MKKNAASDAKSPSVQEVCIDLPGETVQCWRSSDKIRVVLRKHRVCNFARGFQQFETKWAASGQRGFEKAFNRARSEIDWPSLTRKIGLGMEIYLPGMPQKYSPLLSVMDLASMLAGFNLRKVYPISSLFAWAVPMLILASWWLQVVGSGAAPLAKVWELERIYGQRIFSIP